MPLQTPITGMFFYTKLNATFSQSSLSFTSPPNDTKSFPPVKINPSIVNVVNKLKSCFSSLGIIINVASKLLKNIPSLIYIFNSFL